MKDTQTYRIDGDAQVIMQMICQSGKDITNPKDLINPFCELIDNSIDALAKNVYVDFDNKNNTVTVTDDGVGFSSKETFLKCFTNVATKMKNGTTTIGKYNFGHKRFYFMTNPNEEIITTYPESRQYGIQGKCFYGLNTQGKLEYQIQYSDIEKDIDNKGTKIEYKYSENKYKAAFNEKNITTIKGLLGRIYQVNQNLTIHFNGESIDPKDGFFTPSSKQYYTKILYVDNIRLKGKSIGKYTALLLKDYPPINWTGRIAMIDGKRVVEHPHALGKYFNALNPNEYRLRIFISFFNSSFDDKILSISNEKDSISILDKNIETTINVLDKKARSLYREETKRENDNEKELLEKSALDKMYKLLEKLYKGNCDNIDGDGFGVEDDNKIGIKDKNGKNGKSIKNKDTRDKHGIAPFVKCVDLGENNGILYKLDIVNREVHINKQERMYKDIILAEENKQSIPTILGVNMVSWYEWRKKFYKNNDITEFLDSIGSVRLENTKENTTKKTNKFTKKKKENINETHNKFF
jgi:Histidine kinase-, DNA gyrase B-, and HSP90-like ATPase